MSRDYLLTMCQSEISLMLPTEYLDSLLEVINIGLQRAKLDEKVRKDLFAWWNVEKEFLENELEKSNQL